MSSTMITLFDRIKETSHSTGTGAFALDGAAPGFGAFGSAYAYNDILYYAISDGVDSEVGSGQYYLNGSTNSLRRWPFASTQASGLVNWGAGTKEVFATYPGKTAVYSASGVNGLPGPQASGIAYWQSPNVMGYDSNFIWDSGRDRLGIVNASPSYSIDVGGAPDSSAIRASGMIVGTSGVMFSGIPSYSGGRQLEPYIRNQLDSITGTNAVFTLSGVQDQRFQFVKQGAGLVFSGPASGACDPQSLCPTNYPTFRQLVAADIPSLSSIYSTVTSMAATGAAVSGWAGATMSTLDAAVSGWASSTITTKDAAVSGYFVNTKHSIVTSVSSTGRMLNSGDIGQYIRTTNASAVTFTVPSGFVPTIPNAEFVFEQAGSGQISITGNAGVTIRASRSSFSSYGPYAVMTLKNISQDVYTLYGDRA